MARKLVLCQLLALHSVSGFVQIHQQFLPIPSVRLPTTQLYSSSTAPEPLVTEGDWAAYLDESTTGLVYYFNNKSGESRWVPPTSTFPNVKLSRSQKRIAEEKQKQYRATTTSAATNTNEQASTETTEKKGIFSSMLKDKSKSKNEEEWFSFLAPVDTQTDTAERLEDSASSSVEKEPDKDWLGGLKNLAATRQPASSSTETVSTAVDTEDAPVTAAPNAQKKEGFFDKLVAKTRERVAQAELSASSVVDEPKESVDTEVDEPFRVITPDIDGYVMAAPQKILWGGEDAIFTKSRTFGVFDGVSGAEKLTGKPLYSKMLAQLCDERVAADQSLTIQDMQKILVDSVKICNEKATGATTALLASIGPDGFLRVLNVGDAALVVVRGDKVVARTKEISHFYECPYQFSEISPDKPRDGTKLNCELVKGDILVAGSDGIFDNLPDNVVIDVIRTCGAKPASVLAKAIGERARKVSQDRKAETPYAVAAQKQNNPDYSDGLGGKVDDISCVVVRYE